MRDAVKKLTAAHINEACKLQLDLFVSRENQGHQLVMRAAALASQEKYTLPQEDEGHWVVFYEGKGDSSTRIYAVPRSGAFGSTFVIHGKNAQETVYMSGTIPLLDILKSNARSNREK